MQINRQRGYTFIDLAMSLAILGLLLSGIVGGMRIYIKDKQMEQTREYARVAARAIDNYVLEKGRLPCPAPLNAQIEDARYGSEVAACATLSGAGAFDSAEGVWVEEAEDQAGKYVVRGMVPFASLNLPEFYAYDAYGNRLMYAVVAGKTDEMQFTEENGGITVMDSSKDAGAAGDNRRRNHYLVFSTGVDGNGGWSRYGVQTRPCNEVSLDGENCNTATDSKARYVMARYSTADGASRYDDVMVNRTTMHMPLWKPVSSGSGDNIRTVDGNMLSRITQSGGEAYTAPANIVAGLKLDVGGDTQAHKVRAEDYCIHGDAKRCFSPRDLLGDGGRSAQLTCGAGEVVEKISDTRMGCRKFDVFSVSCGTNEYMAGLLTNGDPDCRPYVYNRGEPPVLVVGSCGAAHQSHGAVMPASDLCSSGQVSAVSGTGEPWTWQCAGSGGGQTAECVAWLYEPPVDGACGSANNNAYENEPGGSLKCSAGEVKNLTGDATWKWKWRCRGLHGGSHSADCAAKEMIHGACGAADGTNRKTAPSAGLCSIGTASAINTDSTGWSWTCAGVNGGNTPSCHANLQQDGVCGSASGVPAPSLPTTNLCTTGSASSVGGSNPYNWSCSGVNGGAAASCATGAPTTTNGACGSANGASLAAAPSGGALCAGGTASSVSGSGPWTWTCSGGGVPVGATASCSANKVTTANGQCGSAHGSSVPSAPASSLCNVGTASAVTGTGPWNWTCSGVGAPAGSSVSCWAANSNAINGECGSAQFGYHATKPTSNLCAVGTASSVTDSNWSGYGWTWECYGSGGGTYASCQADGPKPDPVCGPAHGVPRDTSPSGSTSLCSAGMADVVNPKPMGDGWTWACYIYNGGRVNCEAPKATYGWVFVSHQGDTLNPSGPCTTVSYTTNGVPTDGSGVPVCTAPYVGRTYTKNINRGNCAPVYMVGVSKDTYECKQQ